MTGRKHQIRVHLAHQGHSVVGDSRQIKHSEYLSIRGFTRNNKQHSLCQVWAARLRSGLVPSSVPLSPLPENDVLAWTAVDAFIRLPPGHVSTSRQLRGVCCPVCSSIVAESHALQGRRCIASGPTAGNEQDEPIPFQMPDQAHQMLSSALTFDLRQRSWQVLAGLAAVDDTSRAALKHWARCSALFAFASMAHPSNFQSSVSHICIRQSQYHGKLAFAPPFCPFPSSMGVETGLWPRLEQRPRPTRRQRENQTDTDRFSERERETHRSRNR